MLINWTETLTSKIPADETLNEVELIKLHEPKVEIHEEFASIVNSTGIVMTTDVRAVLNEESMLKGALKVTVMFEAALRTI